MQLKPGQLCSLGKLLRRASPTESSRFYATKQAAAERVESARGNGRQPLGGRRLGKPLLEAGFQAEHRGLAQVKPPDSPEKEALMFSGKKLAASAAVLSFVLIGPALAASDANNGGSNASGPAQVVDASASAIRTLSANPNFINLLKKADGVFIVPTLVKGALVVGGSGGTGVLLAHDNGHWSDPAFMTIGSISIGAQAGGKAGSVVMFLMTPKAVAAFTQHDNFSINGNANLTVVTWSPNAQGSVGKGDVIVWSGQNGAFAGLDISGSDVHADTGYDKAYYNNKLTNTKQIIQSQISPANASKLTRELPG
jgi:lipid-binding SYLF domain-containing protein